MGKIKVGIIGLGYWGPNLVRNFHQHSAFEVLWGCDIDDSHLKKIKKDYPFLKVTQKASDLYNDPELDLIVVSTPPKTHFSLGEKILKSGKHLWVEKPFTTSFKKAKKLFDFAKTKHLYLHVDLPYIFSSPVMSIKKILKNKAIGKPYFYNSIRTNLGLIQSDTNVLWDLAPHDISILYYLFPDLKVKKIVATGSSHLKNDFKNEISSLILYFTNNFVAYIHLSWLSPAKIRLITIGGQKKMILFDDIQPTEKVKVYNKNIEIIKSQITPFKPVYRTGDVWIPSLGQNETLYNQVDFLSKKLRYKKFDYYTADIGLKILKILDRL